MPQCHSLSFVQKLRFEKCSSLNLSPNRSPVISPTLSPTEQKSILRVVVARSCCWSGDLVGMNWKCSCLTKLLVQFLSLDVVDENVLIPWADVYNNLNVQMSTELPSLLPIVDVAEALLHVRNGDWFLCLLVANVPDSFNEGKLLRTPSMTSDRPVLTFRCLMSVTCCSLDLHTFSRWQNWSPDDMFEKYCVHWIY